MPELVSHVSSNIALLVRVVTPVLFEPVLIIAVQFFTCEKRRAVIRNFEELQTRYGLLEHPVRLLDTCRCAYELQTCVGSTEFFRVVCLAQTVRPVRPGTVRIHLMN